MRTFLVVWLYVVLIQFGSVKTLPDLVNALLIIGFIMSFLQDVREILKEF